MFTCLQKKKDLEPFISLQIQFDFDFIDA